ncbi:hypothetical protein PHYC_01631 [Phycisphaerales bacterium]|nr:hypothetical protein PHYC_01631 [Phycisphaerales bacterium]
MLLNPVAVLIVVTCVLAACASTPRNPVADSSNAHMTLVYLETGPNSASHTPEQKSEIFKGHMANMQRLAEEKKLLIAGPFGKPRNPAWRGIFVFDIASVAEAEALGATDPGVVAGEFKLAIRPITASASLRESLRLEKEMQAELERAGQPERKPGEPPPGLRRYVMMHAEDGERAMRALRKGGPRVIWWASFRDGKDAVMVLDATEVDEAEAGLRGVDVGPRGLDRWMSTKALERLSVATPQ